VDTHDTEANCRPVGSGVGWTDQVPPFHNSTKALLRRYFAVPEEPTPTQKVVDGQDTSCSELFVVTAGTVTLAHELGGVVVADVRAT
jgi:hypothetical protein